MSPESLDMSPFILMGVMLLALPRLSAALSCRRDSSVCRVQNSLQRQR